MAAIDDSYKSLRFLRERENEEIQFWSSTQAYHQLFISGGCEWCQCPTLAILDVWCFVLRKKSKVLLHRVILLDVHGLPTTSLQQTFLKERSC